MAGFRSGDRETNGFCDKCGRIYWGISREPVSRYFRCGQEGHYNQDCSQRKSKVCSICSQPDHVKADYPWRVDGAVLDVTYLA